MTKFHAINEEDIPELFAGYQHRVQMLGVGNYPDIETEEEFTQWLEGINWRIQENIASNCKEAYKILLRESRKLKE